MGIHHVAFAHPEGAGAHDVLNDLFGLPVVHTERADGMVERMIDTGHGYLQTLEAGSGEGVINRFVERNGGRLHHVALEVEDIAGAVSELVDRGVEMVDKEPRRGGDGTMIAFIHPNATAGMLVELVEVA
ncbi:MAG: methylmalonyl-CoA epimerase [Actinobacteria bacterium]|nr:methylmalonyl-CoA epimerase [Actinomycetota bacterium]